MPFYDIANLRIEVKNRGGRTEKQAKKYLSLNQNENDIADISIDITPERVTQTMEAHPALNQDDWEYMLTGSDFYRGLLDYCGILLHSSCIVYNGKAYCFSADSGTGKSTHTSLWLKNLKEKCHMLNDDKPAIRVIDNVVYACGTPWSGSLDWSTNEIVPLGGIVLLERSDTNWIKKADTKKAIYGILSQTVRELGEEKIDKLVYVLNEIFDKVPVYQFGCDISEDALKTSFEELTHEKYPK